MSKRLRKKETNLKIINVQQINGIPFYLTNETKINPLDNFFVSFLQNK